MCRRFPHGGNIFSIAWKNRAKVFHSVENTAAISPQWGTAAFERAVMKKAVKKRWRRLSKW
jgi:hypothetical protein